MIMEVYSVVLAAGEGKRMKSELAKPLHKVCGKSMIEWVLDAAATAGSQENIVVIGHKAEEVKAYLGERASYAYQYSQQGTGDAVMRGIEPLEGKCGTVMVLYGDTPLIQGETLRQALHEHMKSECAATVITAETENPYGYGRIVRKNGKISKIVEQKDTTEEEAAICEINVGMYFFDLEKLRGALGRITNNNSQGEYYLTDTIEILLSDGENVGTYIAPFEETLGVNDRVQLAEVEKIQNSRLVKAAMLNGVTMLDPSTVHLEADVVIGQDTVIYPSVVLEGKTIIGARCQIGPNTHLTDCEVGEGTEVADSVGLQSKIGCHTHVGPFAYLRPNSVVGSNVKIGDFVEIKNSNIGNGTKVAHLTYVGDADVGERVNFGCGTVVVNYDGKVKHRTTIGDDAFIGCNTNLVSPVTVNRGAYTAAGSTITDEVPEDALAIARSRQTVKEHWATDRKKK